MDGRKLFIIAYDITDETRLNKLRHFLKGYSTGGQKSVYECFLTEAELSYILDEIKSIIDEDHDRVHVFQVDRRARIITLGIALPPRDPSYFYID